MHEDDCFKDFSLVAVDGEEDPDGFFDDLIRAESETSDRRHFFMEDEREVMERVRSLEVLEEEGDRNGR